MFIYSYSSGQSVVVGEEVGLFCFGVGSFLGRANQAHIAIYAPKREIILPNNRGKLVNPQGATTSLNIDEELECGNGIKIQYIGPKGIKARLGIEGGDYFIARDEFINRGTVEPGVVTFHQALLASIGITQEGTTANVA
jgi:sRNA-binding carbon storage regulator CsrA